MKNHYIKSDRIIFSPDDVDLKRSPLRKGLNEDTYVLGAFNPGLCRLPNGNLLLMLRIAEALKHPVHDDNAYSIRWHEPGFKVDAWPLSEVTMDDPRKFRINNYNYPVYALTSLSWLLPVELNEDGSSVLEIHYKNAIAPAMKSQEYGIEDPRISFIDNRYYMTVCCVSEERHSTMLYDSEDGLNYEWKGIILDHQNKDMLLFEGKINGEYYALTRPLGECYFASPPGSLYHSGPGIQMATSKDLLYWKPKDESFLCARKSSLSNEKIGGGCPPILTSEGWLMIYHGVQSNGGVGVYRTFWALLDRHNPQQILFLEDDVPLLEASPVLTEDLRDKRYLEDIVFTTGIVKHMDDFIIASGELDLACRMTIINQDFFKRPF